ncbi:hypothetical protein HPG69_012406 [Diceros bicornis minor]|uniref:Lysozyme n=1 Tax=Diceros bicornis minor TaxID=77932 RepID=A0A7J7FMH3_DICBM|nr:hypothetical protein HPG69_012406 [Diceros bicornis minor]
MIKSDRKHLGRAVHNRGWQILKFSSVLPPTGLGMKVAGILALIGCLVTVTDPKVYTRCKLAKIFSRAGLDNYRGFSLGNWICMAYYESHYNTTAQTALEDGSTDYGIFQINSFTWCRNAKLQEKNHCHVACSGTALFSKNIILGDTGRKADNGISICLFL